jgi:hypothetical protein
VAAVEEGRAIFANFESFCVTSCHPTSAR